MNQLLQHVLQFLEQDKTLSAEEKAAALQSLKDADKELDQKEKEVAAQNRELEIEAALEKVRAVAMSMRAPSDLLAICEMLFNELHALGFSECRNTMINIHNDDKNYLLNYDYAAATGKTVTNIPYNFHSVVDRQMEVTRNVPDAFYEFSLTGKELKEFRELRKRNGEQDDPKLEITNALHYYIYSIGTGSIGISTYSSIVGEKLEFLKRFRNVFNLSYQRYTDIALAEAQAKEAKIEAALERVRSKTMAMHNSADVGETAAVMVDELKKLGIETIRCGIGIMHEPGDMEVWTITTDETDKTNIVIGWLDMNMHSLLHGAFESWRNKIETYYYDLNGDDLLNYYIAINNYPGYPIRYDVANLPKQIHHNEFHFAEGTLFAFSLQQLTDDQRKIFKRFAGVFGQTYRRYLDLKHAEAQAREARVETALERVRSRTMGMYHSNELAGTASLLFQQIKELGFELWSCGFCIWRENDCAELWMNNDSGGLLPPMMIPYKEEPTHRKIYEASLRGDTVHEYVWEGEALEKHYAFLQTIPSVKNAIDILKKSGLSLPARQCYYVGFFKHGYLLLISKEPAIAASDLTGRFAKVFDQTYTRFLDLQKVEAHAIQAGEDLIKLQAEKKRAEDALTELRETQKQLIQSEKMASLGELTAGIAHEIQNPLNFVNNFSEVSNELVEELKGERQKGEGKRDPQLEDDLLSDIAQNLEKINHHGKRADAIVKGMLQHSRSSSGQKEPVNLNALADEYLRLAYHGLRAKDKSFNATLKTEYDDTIGNVNIVPQDIGRVILNLITNAFYATNERKKLLAAVYEPLVTVSTKKKLDKVEISISDNGGGIPQNIIDKIFQPFFTTKPTGQGTGLGLSLAYDIVKAHGGELKVETKEGEGSEFIIQLPIG